MDTRLGTLNLLNPDWCNAVASQPAKYRTRLSDEFSYICPDIDDAAYKAAYAKRDVEVLQRSSVTEVIVHLGDITDSLRVKHVNGDPTVSSFEFRLNIYPYRLTQEEEQEYVTCLAFFLKINPAMITIVNVPPEMIDHSYIRNNEISVYFVYNYRDWINKAFTMAEPPDGDPTATVVAPALVASLAETKALWEKNRHHKEAYLRDSFVASRLVMASVFSVDFRPVETFSMFDSERFKRSMSTKVASSPAR